jgi:hypothetical protein
LSIGAEWRDIPRLPRIVLELLWYPYRIIDRALRIIGEVMRLGGEIERRVGAYLTKIESRVGIIRIPNTDIPLACFIKT